MDGRAWWAALHGVAKSQTRLSDFTFTFHFHALGKEMATHSSVLALEIPRDGGAWWAPPSMGLHTESDTTEVTQQQQQQQGRSEMPRNKGVVHNTESDSKPFISLVTYLDLC